MAMAVRIEREEISKTDHNKRHADDSRLTQSDRFLFFIQNFLTAHSLANKNSLAVYLINNLLPFTSLQSAVIRQRAVSLVGHIISSLCDDEVSDELEDAVEACEKTLIPRLHDTAPGVRAEAAYALRRLQRGVKDCEVTSQYLLSIALEQNKLVRRTLTTAIALSSFTAKRGIARLALDTDDGIRLLVWRKLSGAKRSLRTVPPITFAEILARGLSDPVSRVRNAALSALLTWFRNAREDPMAVLRMFGLDRFADLEFGSEAETEAYFANVDVIATELARYVLDAWARALGGRAAVPEDVKEEEAVPVLPALLQRSTVPPAADAAASASSSPDALSRAPTTIAPPALAATVLQYALARSAVDREVDAAAFFIFRDPALFVAAVARLVASYKAERDDEPLRAAGYMLRAFALCDFTDICVQRSALQCAAQVLRRSDLPTAECLVAEAMGLLNAVQSARHDVVHNPYRSVDTPVGAVVAVLLALLEPKQVFDIGQSPSLLSPLASQTGGVPRDGDVEDRLFSFSQAVVRADEAGDDAGLDRGRTLWVRSQHLLARWYEGPRSAAAMANDELLGRVARALLSWGDTSDIAKAVAALGDDATAACVRAAVPLALRVPRRAADTLAKLVEIATTTGASPTAAAGPELRATATAAALSLIAGDRCANIPVGTARAAVATIVASLDPEGDGDIGGVGRGAFKAAVRGLTVLLVGHLDMLGAALAAKTLSLLLLQFAAVASGDDGSIVSRDALRLAAADATQPIVTGWTRCFLQPFAEAGRDRRAVVVAAAGGALRLAAADPDRFSLSSLIDAISSATRARASCEIGADPQVKPSEAALATACVHEDLIEWFVCDAARALVSARRYAEATSMKGLSAKGRAKAKSRVAALLSYATTLTAAAAKLEPHRFVAIVRMRNSSKAKDARRLELLLEEPQAAETVAAGARVVLIGNTLSALLTRSDTERTPAAALAAAKAAAALAAKLAVLVPLTTMAAEAAAASAPSSKPAATKRGGGDDAAAAAMATLRDDAQRVMDAFVAAAGDDEGTKVVIDVFDGTIASGPKKAVRRGRKDAAADSQPAEEAEAVVPDSE